MAEVSTANADSGLSEVSTANVGSDLSVEFQALLQQCDKATEEETPIPCFRLAVENCLRVMQTQFGEHHWGRELLELRTRFIDHLLQRLWTLLLDQENPAPPVALIAVGGYGRGELHPYSDIDLLLLVEKPRHLKPLTGFFREFLTALWDIRLEVGHSARCLKECVQEARKDITVATNLMEARLIAGPQNLLDQLLKLTGPNKLWPSEKFFSAKLTEQRERHERFGDSAYLLEPNIKESPGGLRDLQMIGWVVKRHYGATNLHELVGHGFLDQQEYDYLVESQEFLWQIRNGLHLITKHKEDQLFFEYQRVLAAKFGYRDESGSLAVEQFMNRYFRVVQELHRFSEMVLQSFQEEILGTKKSVVRPINSRFQTRNGYLEATRENVFSRYPFALLEVFLIIQNNPSIQGVRAATTRLIRKNLRRIDEKFRQDIRATSLFMEILRQPSGISHELRRMHRYGVLARYLPEFGEVVGQMQHDLFHIYTVDEHSLWVVRNIRCFSSPAWCGDTPQAYDIFKRLPKPELLYLAGLFHDIGKGRGGDHSRIGADLAKQFCIRHSLSEYDTALVGWLIQQHLGMSTLSQKEDISDPDVIRRFAERVGDTVRLDYLYLLTIADMKGTSPKVWNSWKGALLDTLYLETRREINKEMSPPEDLSLRLGEIQKTVHGLLRNRKFPADAIDSVFANLSAEYFLSIEPRLIAWQTGAVLEHKSLPLVSVENFPHLGSTAILVYCRDKPGIFATITCELSRLGLQVVDARIHTGQDHHALDSFLVLTQHGEPVTDKQQIEEIRGLLEQALAREPLEPKLPKRRSTSQQRAFRMPTRVNFYTDFNRNRTVMELVTSNRPGLLARIAIILNRLQLSVSGARINTYGERAEDIFFLHDNQNDNHTNGAISSAEKLDELRHQLRTELDVDLKT